MAPFSLSSFSFSNSHFSRSMIQRIQSVYLVLGALALLALLLIDAIWNGAAAQSQSWFAPAVLILGGLAALVALVAVFLYKDRERQHKVIILAQGLTVLHLIALYLGLFLADALYVRTSSGIDVAMLIALVLPLAAYIFFLLARRGVKKDIELVKSMDRLR